MRKPLLFSAVLFLFLLVPASIIRAQTISSQKGLTTAIFTTQYGNIKVYLPDDIRPGEMISGTVIAEPKGNNARQLEKNLAELMKFSVSVDGNKYAVPAKEDPFKWIVEKDRQLACPLELLNISGLKAHELTIQFAKVDDNQAIKLRCAIPSHVLTAAPCRITGSFDGDASNTKCNLNSQPMQILAESPRQCIVQVPSNASGQQTIQVNENGQEKCTKQISGVDMQVTTGDLNLRKGQSTYIDVKLTGLQSLPGKATLTIVNTTPNVVLMTNGNTQVIPVWPPPDSAQGTFFIHCPAKGITTGNFVVNINLDLPDTPSAFYEKNKTGDGNKQDSIPCHPTPEEVTKAEDAVKALENELAGIDGKIREVSIAGVDCKELLEKLADEYRAAKKAFEVQKTRKEQYDLNPKLFTDAQKKAMEKDYKDANETMEAALVKWREQKEKCKKLDEELTRLKERKKSLPGLITDASSAAEKTRVEAEKCKQMEEEEKKKKKEEEEKKKTGALPGGNGGVKPGEETTSPAGKPCQPEGSKMITNERIYEPCEVEETVITPCNVSEFQGEVLDKIKDLLNLIKKLKDPIELAEKIAKVSSASKAICINVHIIRKWKDVEHTWECVNGKWVEVNTKTTNNGVDKYGSFQVMDGSLKCCWVFDGSKAMEAEVANKIQERLDQCK